MFTIGEFSRASGITVKALRHYHEQGLLVPSRVDAQSGYRYYDVALLERARILVYLRGLEFSLDEIGTILKHAGDEGQLLGAIERHRATIDQRIKRLRSVRTSLDQFIRDERRNLSMSQSNVAVEEKLVPEMLVAGIRMTGRYADSGKTFARLGRAFGRHIAGPALMLHYDTEYKEDDADFEPAFPIRQAKATPADGVYVRTIPAARCVCLVHKGPYDHLGSSYAKAFQYAKDKGYAIESPTREVYIKGPGMFFKGNPKNYLTEIQLPFHADASPW